MVLKMGKKKSKNEEKTKELILPNDNNVLGVTT
jgi:hypothetical protein